MGLCVKHMNMSRGTKSIKIYTKRLFFLINGSMSKTKKRVSENCTCIVYFISDLQPRVKELE